MTKFILGLTIGCIGTTIAAINITQSAGGEFVSAACASPTPPTSTNARLVCGSAQAKARLDGFQKNIQQFVDKIK